MTIKEIAYPVNVEDTALTGMIPAVLSLGWDLSLAVNVVGKERQVWAFDASGNSLACLLKVRDDDPTPDAQLLALCVDTAIRCYPSHVDPGPDSTYDYRVA